VTEPEQLFLDTVADLKDKMARGDGYALIKASGLLRLLLADAHPLVHQVDKAYDLPLRFETIDYTMKPPYPQLIIFRWSVLDASAIPGARKRSSTLDEFLAAEILTFEGKEFTVLQVIRAAAHVKGGVHAGTAESDHEQALLDLGRALTVGGLDASVAALRGIIAVTLAALEPIVAAVKSAN
jgi:hypothetical protein